MKTNDNDQVGTILWLNTEEQNRFEATGATIMAFKIGRGGRFNNSNHLSFIGEQVIAEFTNDLFLKPSKFNKLLNEWANSYPNLADKLQECWELNNYSFFEKKGIDLGDMTYYDEMGNSVDLTEKEAETGIGRIDIDGEYNTIYTKYLRDCNEKELYLVLDEMDWDDNVKEYCYNCLNIELEIE